MLQTYHESVYRYGISFPKKRSNFRQHNSVLLTTVLELSPILNLNNTTGATCDADDAIMYLIYYTTKMYEPI